MRVLVKVRALSGDHEVLTGSGAGRALLRELLAVTHRATSPTPFFLDFSGVQAATGSFLREGILAYRDAVRRPGSLVYPIIANANTTVLEDLEVVLALRNDALLACDLLDGVAVNVRVIGTLEAKQALTYERLRRGGDIDAVSLAREEHQMLQGTEKPPGHAYREARTTTDVKQQSPGSAVPGGARSEEADAVAGVAGAATLTSVTATKWNNRLAGLAAKGIAAEFAQGRAKRYRLAVVEGHSYGC